MEQARYRVFVWDLPTRLGHWALVVLVGSSWLTAELDRIDLHMVSGLALLSVLLFRFAWGFVGSETARFSRFLRGPHAVLHYLRTLQRPDSDRMVGHNPAGGWMVAAMLALLGVQAVTGLGANDDLVHEGPLAKVLGKSLSDRITAVHDANFNLILAAIGLHVAAILFYRVVKAQDLVRPMLDGWVQLPAAGPVPRRASAALAAALYALAAGLAWWLGRL